MLKVCPDKSTSSKIVNSFTNYVITMFKNIDGSIKLTADRGIQTDLMQAIPIDSRGPALAVAANTISDERLYSSQDNFIWDDKLNNDLADKAESLNLVNLAKTNVQFSFAFVFHELATFFPGNKVTVKKLKLHFERLRRNMEAGRPMTKAEERLVDLVIRINQIQTKYCK